MEFLVLSVQSSQNIDLYKEITRIIAKMGCHICTLQGQKLATEHVLIGMVSGNWNTLTRLETELNHFKREKQLELFFKRTKQPEQKSQLLPYSVEVLALDQMGMLHHICHFFSEQKHCHYTLKMRQLHLERNTCPHVCPQYLSGRPELH